MGFFSALLTGSDRTQVVDLSRLDPPPGGRLKLAGRFVFYGTMDDGDPQYDLPPPSGVVRVQYKYEDRANKNPNICQEKGRGRVGFFRCTRFQFRSFLHAWALWNDHTSWGDYDAEGTYPNVKTLVVPYGERAA